MTAMEVLSLNDVTILVINSTDKALQTARDTVHRDQNLVFLTKKAPDVKSLLLSLRDSLESSKDTDPWLEGVRTLYLANGPMERYWTLLKHPQSDWNLASAKENR